MKNTGIILMLIYLSGIFILAKTKKTDRELPGMLTPATRSSHPVVLELFTSEGCSSCPPADQLLQQMAKEDSNLVPLSFHVDYWDRLGWKDPFSNHLYTERQEDYARHFKLESTYTPELVVNGETEMVGSNRKNAEIAIRNAEAAKITIIVDLNKIKQEKGKIECSVLVTGSVTDQDLIVALVQKTATEKVKAGENKGATLSHINIVQQYISQEAKNRQDIELKEPSKFDAKDYRLIMYLQDKTDFKITGAAVYNL
jgi:hypothetical protein